MSSTLVPRRQGQNSWVIDVTPEMAEAIDAPEGSRIILSLSKERIAAELLPPASAEIKANVKRLLDKYGDAFEEMKWLGD